MISVILPYWRRAEVTARSLALYDKHYKELEFEVVLVDDGSGDVDGDYPWLRIIRLPLKDYAKNPCVPINAGVRAANGDVLVLSNPEVLHNNPVLLQMKQELDSLGENGYVLAACWCEDDKKWHCHSHITAGGYHEQLRQPKGSGFHFCAMLNRSLWDKAGGFDEDYRDGRAFDDPDWVMRVNRAGGVFKIRDDLVVEHVRRGAVANWSGGDNKNLYLRKWENA